MRSFWTLLVLASLAAASAAPGPVQRRGGQRIVGGAPTTVENYPYMVNMQYLWNNNLWIQWCGGTLLTNRSVISAAHCYIGDPANRWRVRVGTSWASSGGTVLAVSELVLHPGYDDNTLNNDVAIVRLSQPAQFSASVQPARIAGTDYNLADGTLVQTIGWGALSPGGSSPEQVQYVELNIINQQLCSERYAYLKTQPGYQNWPDITDGMLCAGILNVGGADACQGDSGGPLVHQGDILVGVVSWGFSCADAFYPGVNARVSHYTGWIVDNA